MLKKSLSISLLFLFVISFLLDAQIYYPAQTVSFEGINPAQIVIAFDVDKVLVWQHNTKKFIQLLFSSNYRKKYLAKIGFWCIVHWREIKHKHKDLTGSAVIYFIAEHFPELRIPEEYGKKIAEDLKKAVYNGTVIDGAIALITSLRNHGYLTTIATNRGRESFNYLVDNHILPSYAHYNLIFTPDYGNYLENPEAAQQYVIAMKPHNLYFEQMKTAISKNLPEATYIIFIDDKQENVTAAAKAGITAIQCKNIRQVKRDLKKLGISL